MPESPRVVEVAKGRQRSPKIAMTIFATAVVAARREVAAERKAAGSDGPTARSLRLTLPSFQTYRGGTQ
jgi:hypothetical protein